MNFPTTNEAAENYRMVAVKVFNDHRQMEQCIEFRIDPAFYEETIVELNKLAKKINDTTQDEDGDSEIMCEAGYDGCDHDDYETMSDDCKHERAEQISEARTDTYG